MPKKSEGVAILLNFFLPGIGFAYFGRPYLVVGGLMFFAASFFGAFANPQLLFTPKQLILSFAQSIALGIVAGDVAEIFNRMAPTERKCPFCAETIKAEAKVCKHCDRELQQSA